MNTNANYIGSLSMTKDELRTLIMKAEDAFWEVIHERFPEVKSGDLSPLATIAFAVAAEQAVEEWIINNVVDSTPEDEVADD